MIRRARPEEQYRLTDISFRSKAHWPYPQHYFEIWKKELTITSGYIDSNEVHVHEERQEIHGYYSLVELPRELVVSGIRLEAGLWLDHMFVVPEKIGRGIGQSLFHHCLLLLTVKQQRCLNVLADPYARGFYEKMGCRFIEDYPSSIAGRTTPYLQYVIETP